MDLASSAAPLVGRARELDQIARALDALAGGGAGWLTFEGEAGIGKTRLLAELRTRGEAAGHLVLGGSAAEFERDVPFSVWIDALDAYVASQELGRHAAWSDALAAELAAVLPRMQGRVAGGEAPLPDERYRMHRAIQTLLGILSEDQALVLVLDDLHWIDTASLELLASLLRRGMDGDVLVALGFRPGQAPERLAGALLHADVTRLRLVPLNEGEAGELLAGVGAEPAAAIYRHSGGNPFFLEQLARAAEGGTLPARLDEPGAGALPDAVAASLSDETASASEPARRLLAAAAIAGEPFEPGLAAAIAELPAADGLTALDELLSVDLVRSTDVPRRFVFRHPLVRRAVYESASAGWRLAAHARAAQALTAAGASAAERAYHVEQVAGRGDEGAIAVLLEAGDEAAPRAPAAAARWYEATLELLPVGDRARHAEVRVRLAGALRSQGDLERCRSVLLEASELLPPGDTARRAELTAMCAAVEHWLGRHDDAHRRLTWALEDLPGADAAEAATLRIEHAVDGLFAMDLAQTCASGSVALDIARRLGDPVLVATAAAVLALAEAATGRVDDARVHRDEAAALVGRASDGELAGRLDVLYHLGWAQTYLEDYDAAIALADRGIALARATGDGRLLVPLMLVKGYPYQMLGRLAEAITTTESAVEIARSSGNPHYLFWTLFELGWARYFAGHLDAAVAACEESAAVGGRLIGGAMPSVGGGPGTALAVCKLESGDAAGALEMMREIFEAHEDRWPSTESCFNWETLVLAELGVGDLDGADRYACRAERDAAAIDLHLPSALAGRCRCVVALAREDAPGALASAQTSLGAADAAGAPLEAAYARLLLGRAHALAGDGKAAVQSLRQAERELDRFGSERSRDEARRELRALGVRHEPRSRAADADGGLASLSARETEIAALVYDRMTNKQIGATLFLSEKTIESHMRNIFLKLDVSSRVAVARAVERERREQAAAPAP